MYVQTSNQSVFLLHAMANHPEVQERLYKELRSVLGDSICITSEHLSQLPYLKGCKLSMQTENSAYHIYLCINRYSICATKINGIYAYRDTAINNNLFCEFVVTVIANVIISYTPASV